MSAQAAPGPDPRRLFAGRLPLRLDALDNDGVYAVVLGIAIGWIAIHANGGLRIGNLTVVEIVIDLLAGLVAAVAVLAVPTLRGSFAGATATAMFGLLALTSVVSAVWSVDPSTSWQEANRLFSYLATFGIGLALVRLAPYRLGAVLGGITIAAVGVSAYALAHKAFPGQLQPDERWARLEQPFGYWNAVGLMAALGVPGCLWLGARRTGNAALNALAYPGIGLLVVVVMFAYSRGALLALAIGCAFWFACTPLRLRGAMVLLTGAVGGAAVTLWAFAQDALTTDRTIGADPAANAADLALRDGAGHELALAVLFMLLVELLVGLALSFAADRRTLTATTRRRIGTVLLIGVALVPIAFGGYLAQTPRGFTGSISHAWHNLTDPTISGVTNGPQRLTGVASVRAKYWDQALKIFKDHPVAGVGPGGYALARLRYREPDDTLDVQHAHGYVVQTLADRGLIGLVLSLAALIAVGVATARATGLGRRRRDVAGATPERVGLLTLAAVVVTFGIHSAIDWTWYVPGVALPALLAGGWLCGRGALDMPPRPPLGLVSRIGGGLRNPSRALGAAVAVLLALCAAWAAWQPQRSVAAGDQALDAASAGEFGKALSLIDEARSRDPLSITPYTQRAAIQQAAGDDAGALRSYQEAVRRQPGDPQPWTDLADFQLNVLHRPATAKKTLSAALYLDPQSRDALSLLITANAQLAAKAAS